MITEILICLLGWLIYQLFMLNIEKNELDSKGKHFSFKQYALENWDDWLFTLMAALGLYLISPDIFLLLALNFDFMETLHYSNKIPFFIGAFGGFIFEWVYEKLKSKLGKK